jgi:hypothetical protein
MLFNMHLASLLPTKVRQAGINFFYYIYCHAA